MRAGADLAGADLAGADLAGADLAGADLAGAERVGADCVGAGRAVVVRFGTGLAVVVSPREDVERRLEAGTRSWRDTDGCSRRTAVRSTGVAEVLLGDRVRVESVRVRFSRAAGRPRDGAASFSRLRVVAVGRSGLETVFDRGAARESERLTFCVRSDVGRSRNEIDSLRRVLGAESLTDRVAFRVTFRVAFRV